MSGNEIDATGEIGPRPPRDIQDIATDIAELRVETRAAGFGFLTYLLGMALQECVTLLKLAHPKKA